jgi:hypothetical protein
MDIFARLRFLRARKWIVPQAVAMAHSWYDWYYATLVDPDLDK